MQSNTDSASQVRPNVLSDFAKISGRILAVSYPVLALSTGVRAIYQLFFKEGVTYLLPPALSAAAAIFYLLATVGFVYRRGWAWRLSVAVLGFEMLMVLLVGALSLIYPDVIGRTVWRHFGADYGFFPLFQPLLGLAWLFRHETLRAYGIRPLVDREPLP
ncbi:MAG: hypothetical protein ACRDIB_12670 [Ardenticatenaceae bacterium]